MTRFSNLAFQCVIFCAIGYWLAPFMISASLPFIVNFSDKLLPNFSVVSLTSTYPVSLFSKYEMVAATKSPIRLGASTYPTGTTVSAKTPIGSTLQVLFICGLANIILAYRYRPILSTALWLPILSQWFLWHILDVSCVLTGAITDLLLANGYLAGYPILGKTVALLNSGGRIAISIVFIFIIRGLLQVANSLSRRAG